MHAKYIISNYISVYKVPIEEVYKPAGNSTFDISMKFFGVLAISSSLASAALSKRDACVQACQPSCPQANVQQLVAQECPSQLDAATPIGQVLIQAENFDAYAPPPQYAPQYAPYAPQYGPPQNYEPYYEPAILGGQCLSRCLCKAGRCIAQCPGHILGTVLGLGRYQYVPYSYGAPRYAPPPPPPMPDMNQLVAQPAYQPYRPQYVPQCPPQPAPAQPVVGQLFAIPVNKNQCQ